MKVIDSVKVTGISSKGTKEIYNYMAPIGATTATAMHKAIEWADREYSCEYDKDMKPISGSEYKCFEEITSVEIMYFES